MFNQKIRMKSITFTYGENNGINNPFPITFTTWEEANSFLFQRSFQDGYYLKHFFTVEYQNGRKYLGRIDVFSRKSGKIELVDLGTHIKKNNMIFSGRQRPHHMQEEDYKGFLAGIKREDKEASANLLDHYEIK